MRQKVPRSEQEEAYVGLANVLLKHFGPLLLLALLLYFLFSS